MAHRLHEGVANLQYFLHLAACSHRSKGHTQAGMREQNSTGTLSHTTLFEDIVKLAFHNNSTQR